MTVTIADGADADPPFVFRGSEIETGHPRCQDLPEEVFAPTPWPIAYRTQRGMDVRRAGRARSRPARRAVLAEHISSATIPKTLILRRKVAIVRDN